jgi:hypothetical protein
MVFRTVFNGQSIVRRQIKAPTRTAIDRPLEHMKVETAPVAKEGTEVQQQGQGIKAPTEMDKQKLKEKLRAELFRGI